QTRPDHASMAQVGRRCFYLCCYSLAFAFASAFALHAGHWQPAAHLVSPADVAFWTSALSVHTGHSQPAGQVPVWMPCMNGHSLLVLLVFLPLASASLFFMFFMCSAAFWATFSTTVQTSSADASQRTRMVLLLRVVFSPSTSFMTSALSENLSVPIALAPSTIAFTWAAASGDFMTALPR